MSSKASICIIYLHTKFGNYRFSLSGGLRVSKLKMDHVTLTMPLLGVFVIRKLGFGTLYLCAKFDDSSFNGSRYNTRVPKH